MDNKKIMILCYDMSIIGGVQTVTQTLADSLSRDDYKVLIVSLIECKRLTHTPSNIDFISLNLPHKRVRKNLIKGTIATRRLIKEYQPDFVLFQGSQMGTFLPFFKKFKDKIVYEDHGEIAYLKLTGKKGYVRTISCVFPQYANCIVTLTNGAKEWLIENNKRIDPAKVYVIKNSVNDDIETNRHPYNQTAHRIIVVSRLVKEKGVERILGMSENILIGYNDWSVDIYGDGEMKEEYINLVPESVKNRIHFKGTVLDKRDIYNDSSFMIFASEHEGFPAVIQEALAFGIPTLSYDICFGPADMIQNEVNGYLVEDGNTDEFVKKCHMLMDNEELCISMSNNAIISSDKYKEKNTVKEWRKLFDEQK